MILRQIRFFALAAVACLAGGAVPSMAQAQAPTPATAVDADFDTLLQARLVRMPEAARQSADFVQGFAGRYLCREMQEARGNEFRMQAALSRSQESIRLTAQRPAAEEVVIRARGSFRNYDFQQGVFPIALDKELLYTFDQTEDRNRGTCFSSNSAMPIRIGVQVANNTGFDGLRMDRDQAERFMAARTDRFNTVNRDIVYEFTVRLGDLVMAERPSNFRQEATPSLAATVVRFRVLDDLRSARPLLEIDRAAMAGRNRAVEIAAAREPIFRRVNWRLPQDGAQIPLISYAMLLPIWHSLSGREAPVDAIVARLLPELAANAWQVSVQTVRTTGPNAEAARLAPVVRELLQEWGQYTGKPFRAPMTVLVNDQGALTSIDGSSLGSSGAVFGTSYRLALRGPGGAPIVLPAELRDRVRPSGRPPIVFAEFVFQAQSAEEGGRPSARQVNGIVRSIVFRDLLAPGTIVHTLEVSPIEAPRPATTMAAAPIPAAAERQAAAPALASGQTAEPAAPAPTAPAQTSESAIPALPVPAQTAEAAVPAPPAPAPAVPQAAAVAPLQAPSPAPPQEITIVPGTAVTILPGASAAAPVAPVVPAPPAVPAAPPTSPVVAVPDPQPAAPTIPQGVTIAPGSGITIVGPTGAPLAPAAPSPVSPTAVPGGNQMAAAPRAVPELRVEPASGTLFVQSTSAMLRAEPSRDGARIATLAQGTQLELTGRVEGGGWARVRHQGRDGFVAANLLAANAPVAAAAVVPRAVEGRASVVDTSNLRVDGQTIRLGGIVGLSGDMAQGFQRFLDSQGGAVRCEPLAGGTFVCRTVQGGVDVAAAALVNGAACPAAGASDVYRQQSEQARANRRGLWANGRCA